MPELGIELKKAAKGNLCRLFVVVETTGSVGGGIPFALALSIERSKC